MYVTGDIIELQNGKEYICLSTVDYKDANYVYLMSNFKPLEIMFAKQTQVAEGVALDIVDDQEDKQELLKLFQEEMNNKTK